MSKKNEDMEVVKADIRLLNSQIEIILTALELYTYNLEFMLTNEKCTDEERDIKTTMAKYTYKTILTSQVTQINGKIEIPDNISPFRKTMLKELKNVIQEDENEYENENYNVG